MGNRQQSTQSTPLVTCAGAGQKQVPAGVGLRAARGPRLGRPCAILAWGRSPVMICSAASSANKGMVEQERAHAIPSFLLQAQAMTQV